MDSWEDALETVLDALDGNTDGLMLVGSAASALQGAAIEPGDIDFLAEDPAAALKLADALAPYAVDGEAPGAPGTEAWRSTRTHPVLLPGPQDDGEAWTFGRWVVRGTKVEVAHIRPAQPEAGLVEVTGEAVWLACRTILWHDRQVPVVPLEVQFATMLTRSSQEDRFTHRARATARALHTNGHDHVLLERALHSRGFTSVHLNQYLD